MHMIVDVCLGNTHRHKQKKTNASTGLQERLTQGMNLDGST